MKRSILQVEKANEIAGVFVIVALALLIAALIMAGRIQGWFEPTFELRVRFDSDEGSYGLVEGSEIRIRNTRAGKVGRILPTEDGNLETTFVILERFRPFVTTGSVAKVKMKFGIAGDAYVDITRGAGPPLDDGDVITCLKDEEIAETAKKVLEEARKVAIPMLDEVQGILRNVNGILGSVEKGEGMAGAIVKDQDMAANVKAAVEQTDELMTSAVGTAREIEVTVRKAQELVSAAARAAQDARSVIRHADDLVIASTDTMQETTRLVRGFQRHWLVRKYVPPQTRHPVTAAIAASQSFSAIKRCEEALQAGRLADDPDGIALAACNLAVIRLAANEIEQASELIREAGAESVQSPDLQMTIGLLEAEVAARTNDLKRSLDILKRASPPRGKPVAEEINAERLAAIAAAACKLGIQDDARAARDELARLAKGSTSPLVKAAAAQADGNLLLAQSKHHDAARRFEEEAAFWRQSAVYDRMADALEQAAYCRETAGNLPSAANLWFRAGRSMWANGCQPEAEKAFSNAMRTASVTGIPDMAARISAVTNTVSGLASEGREQ